MKDHLNAKSLEAIRIIRNAILENTQREPRIKIDSDKWNGFKNASLAISESVESMDLEGLVSGVRKMKNLLRRPSIKRALTIEGEKVPDGFTDDISDSEEDEAMKDLPLQKDDPKDGKKDKGKGKEDKNDKDVCKCSKCGKEMESYQDCLDDALCVDCAMSKKKKAPGEDERKNTNKKAQQGTAFPPEAAAGAGGGGDMGGMGNMDAGGGVSGGVAVGSKVESRSKGSLRHRKIRFDL